MSDAARARLVPILTPTELEALRAAVVFYQVELEDRADHGEKVGREHHALERAWRKVREAGR